MSDFKPGERVLLEDFLQVTFVRDIEGTTDAIIQVGSDSQRVSQFSLNR